MPNADAGRREVHKVSVMRAETNKLSTDETPKRRDPDAEGAEERRYPLPIPLGV